MKSITLAVIVAILCLSFVAWADKAELAKDGRKTKVDGFAPDPAKDIVLTGNSQTIDMTDDIAWGLSPVANCTYRNHSTATVVGNVKTIIGGTERVRVVNENAVHATYSGAGCANEILERQ